MGRNFEMNCGHNPRRQNTESWLAKSVVRGWSGRISFSPIWNFPSGIQVEILYRFLLDSRWKLVMETKQKPRGKMRRNILISPPGIWSEQVDMQMSSARFLLNQRRTKRRTQGLRWKASGGILVRGGHGFLAESWRIQDMRRNPGERQTWIPGWVLPWRPSCFRAWTVGQRVLPPLGRFGVWPLRALHYMVQILYYRIYLQKKDTMLSLIMLKKYIHIKRPCRLFWQCQI